MDINISKVKLTKNNCLEVSYTDNEDNEIILKGSNSVHPDLKCALSNLVPFLADLTEQKEAGSYDWENPDSEINLGLLNRLDVTGVSIGGDDTFRVCTLIGKRTLLTSKVLNLCAPSTGFDPDNEQYERCEDLRDAVNALLFEAEQYVTEKKWAAVQQIFDFKEGEEDPFLSTDEPEDQLVETSNQLDPVA